MTDEPTSGVYQSRDITKDEIRAAVAESHRRALEHVRPPASTAPDPATPTAFSTEFTFRQMRDEIDRLREINVGVGKTITGLRADRDLWRARAEAAEATVADLNESLAVEWLRRHKAEADADQLAVELSKHGYGWGTPTGRSPHVLESLAAHEAAVAARGDR